MISYDVWPTEQACLVDVEWLTVYIFYRIVCSPLRTGAGASPTIWSTQRSTSFLSASNLVCDMVASIRGAIAIVMNSSPVDAHL